MAVTTTVLFVISAPSGAGKTTIAREILRRHPDLLFSLSATTRPIRPGESNGRDYIFLEKGEFEEKIRSGELVEWEEIFGNYYGTLRSQIDNALTSGRSMLFDIDVRGALAIKAKYPEQAVLLFIEPPSIERLTERLNKRMTESGSSRRNRLERVPMEMSMKGRFDFAVVNDELASAVDAVDRIIMDIQRARTAAASGTGA